MGFFDKLFGKKLEGIYAPIAGKAVAITEVPDPTFAEVCWATASPLSPPMARCTHPAMQLLT